MIDFSAVTAELRGLFGLERPFSGAADGSRPSTHQRAPRQVKIGQADQREHLRGILRDPLVAHLRVTELALDHTEQMLHPRTDRPHPVVETLVRLAQGTRLAALQRHAPEHPGFPRMALEIVVHIAFVTKHRTVILTQQVRQLADIGGVGGCHRNRMRQPGIDVGAHVDLHPEVPLLAPLRLMHLGVALLALVLRRGRSMDDCGVNHGTALEQQALLSQRVVDDVHHLHGQPVLLEQVTELKDRRLVGHRIVGQIQPGKAAHRFDLVQRIFHRRVRQGVPLLQEVNPQHCAQRSRRTATPACRRVVRLDHREQRRPRHHRVHLSQEALQAGLLFLLVEGQRGEGRLLHDQSTFYEFCILQALDKSELP